VVWNDDRLLKRVGGSPSARANGAARTLRQDETETRVVAFKAKEAPAALKDDRTLTEPAEKSDLHADEIT
jgi:hypothetical protein